MVFIAGNPHALVRYEVGRMRNAIKGIVRRDLIAFLLLVPVTETAACAMAGGVTGHIERETVSV